MNSAASAGIHRPALSLLVAEPFRAALDFASHQLAKPARAASGDGHPVVIFPGLGTDGKSVAGVRDHCRALGYAALDWGRGFNTGPRGDLDAWLSGLRQHVTQLLQPYPQPATLIGWSLGGLYARELGKVMTPQLRQVITIGTPFNADGDHTHVGWLYGLLSRSSPVRDAALARRLRTPPPLRTTSIYSRSDGLVAWQTCLHDRPNTLVQDIEVVSSHIGMGWNREVLDVVADQLQRPAAGNRRRASNAGPAAWAA